MEPSSASPSLLQQHVEFLTQIKPARSVLYPRSLQRAADYIFQEFKKLGLEPRYQDFKVKGETYTNVCVLLGKPDQKRIVIGAHYDVAGKQPGADDNASGVAGVLELARLLSRRAEPLPHAVELVAYSLEEPPHFGGESMGSYIHARHLRDEKVRVEFMASLEMIGYFCDKRGCQTYPSPFLEEAFPAVGNFIAIAGRVEERDLIERMKISFQQKTSLPLETLSAPRDVPGVDLSDHINYWEFGIKAVIVTDTAFMRNPNYHLPSDQSDTLDYKRMVQVVNGMLSVVEIG